MIVLDDGVSRAEIAEQGGELRTWQVDGTPLIWPPDPLFWEATAPILFPVVGWTRGAGVIVDGTRYPLGLHGFARDRAFSVIDVAPGHVVLRLVSDQHTRALYPFDWSLDVAYTLRGPALETRVTVRNTGSRVMPYACGLHPGFRWPFAGGRKEDYAIHFAELEQTAVPVISPDGLFTRETRAVPFDGRNLPLSEALMATEALCFLDARSQRVRFEHASGAAIALDLEDFPHIALWSRPGAPFLSIEAWTGHGDAVDASGDLADKPSMRHLPPGAEASHAATFTWVDLHA